MTEPAFPSNPMPLRHLSRPPKTAPALPRRQFLHWLWGLPLIATVVQLGGMIAAFGLPRKKAGSFGTIIDIGPLNELPAATDSPRHHSRGKFWLINTEEGLIAVANTCTHLDCLFNWNPEAGLFVCPCHGSQFDRGGRVVSGPATRNLDRFPLLIVAADGTAIARTAPSGSPLLPPATPKDQPTTPAADPGQQPRLQVDTGRRIAASAIAS